MTPQDIFVASVAFAIGVFSLSGAVFNPDWYYRLEKAQQIEARWGRPAARGFYAVVALTLLGLGVAICASAQPASSPARANGGR